MSWKKIIPFIPALLLIVLAAPHLSKPPMADEFDFLNAATFFAEHNSLYYFRAFIDEKIIPQGSLAYQPWVYHPPLAIFIMGAVVKVFGSSVTVLRVFSLLCNLLVVGLLPLLYRRIYPKDDRVGRAGLLAMVLFVSVPLVLHSSLLLDIDNTVLNVFNVVGVILLLSFFRKEEEQGRLPVKELGVLLLVFVLFHLTKQTHYPIFVIVFAFAAILRKRFVAAIATFVVLIVGTRLVGSILLSFVESYYLIDYQWAASYTNVFERLTKIFGMILDPVLLYRHWFHDVKLDYLTPIIPFVLVLLGFSVLTRLARLKVENQDTLVIISIGIYLCLPGYLGQIPKYQIAILPFIACIQAHFLVSFFKEHRLQSALAVLTIGIGLVVNVGMLFEKGDVVYYYGTKGVPEASKFVKENLPESTYYLGDPGLGMMSGRDEIIWLFGVGSSQLKIHPGKPLSLRLNWNGKADQPCRQPDRSFIHLNQIEGAKECIQYPIGIIEIEPSHTYLRQFIPDFVNHGYVGVKLGDVKLLVYRPASAS